MTLTMSTYEAKARFSEVIRRVREGQRIIVTYRGEEVAELRPIERRPETLVERLATLEEEGVVQRTGGRWLPRTVAQRPGALARFLEERE